MTTPTLAPTSRPTRLQIGLWAVVVTTMLAIVAADFAAPAPLSMDGSHYVVLAQSLLDGPGYGLISRIPASTEVFTTSSSFPWGYPLLLASLASFFPGQIEILRWPSLVATLANACLLFWGWGLFGRGSYWWGLAVCGFYCLSPLTIELADQILSEAVFTSFLLAGTLAIEFAARRLPGRLPTWWHPLTSALLVMMVFTRTAGVAMLAGLGFYVLLRHRRAALRQLIPLAVWMAGWTALVVWATPVSGLDLLPVSYLRQWRDIVVGSNRAAADSALSYPQTILNLANRRLYRDIPSAIAPGLDSQFTTVLAARWRLEWSLPWLGRAISLLLLLGFLRWRRQEGVSGFLMAAAPYLLMMLGWRALGPRLLYPVQPQLFYALFFGLETLVIGFGAALTAFRTPAFRRHTIAIASGALLCLYAAVSIFRPDDAFYVQVLEQRAGWIRANTPPSAILMSRQPEIDFLAGRRRGLPYPRNVETFSPAQFAAILEATDVDFLVVEKQTGGWSLAGNGVAPQRGYRTDSKLDHVSELAQALAAQGRLQLRYRADDGYITVYEVR